MALRAGMLHPSVNRIIPPAVDNIAWPMLYKHEFNEFSDWEKGIINSLPWDIFPIETTRHIFREEILFEKEPHEERTPFMCFENAIVGYQPYYFPRVDKDFCGNLQQSIFSQIEFVSSNCNDRPVHIRYMKRKAGEGSTRVIMNEDAIFSMIKKYHPNVNFDVGFPSGAMSFKEQVKLFSEPDIVISLHGSHNVNAIFMRGSSTVFIEIFPWMFYHELMHNVVTQCNIIHVQMRDNLPNFVEAKKHRDQIDALRIINNVCSGMIDEECSLSYEARSRSRDDIPVNVDLSMLQQILDLSVLTVKKKCEDQYSDIPSFDEFLPTKLKAEEQFTKVERMIAEVESTHSGDTKGGNDDTKSTTGKQEESESGASNIDYPGGRCISDNDIFEDSQSIIPQGSAQHATAAELDLIDRQKILFSERKRRLQSEVGEKKWMQSYSPAWTKATPYVPDPNPADPLHDMDRFTVVISTFDRDVLAKRCVEHYAKSKLVSKIILSWNNVNRQPPSTDDFNTGDIEFLIVKETSTSLNNRFLPNSDIRTPCVYNVDDDFLVDIDHLEFGFSVWRQHQSQLVGFLARTHTLNPTDPVKCEKSSNTDGKRWFYSGDCHDKDGSRKFWTPKYGSFSIILDSACFFHRDFLLHYTFGLPKWVYQLVDDTRNCEDIVLPMLLSNLTGLPGVYVEADGKYQHLQYENKKGHHVGLNTMAGHYGERNECLNRLVDAFSAMPLVYNNMKIARVEHNEV
eukprot:g2164.t1